MDIGSRVSLDGSLVDVWRNATGTVLAANTDSVYDWEIAIDGIKAEPGHGGINKNIYSFYDHELTKI